MPHPASVDTTSRPATPSVLSETSSESEFDDVWTGYHPVTTSAQKPSLLAGYAILAVSGLFLTVGLWSALLSAFWPHTGYTILDVLAKDSHYKYFVVLLIPTTAYFVIANWVGWQYYRNS